MRTRSPLLLLAAVVPAFAGCRGPAGGPPPPRCVPQLPTVERRLAPVDVSRVGDESSAAQPAPPPGPYYRLTAEECHRLACVNSTAARLIDVASADQPRSLLDFTPRAADDLRRKIAGHMSRDARIRTAAAALDLYYRLLEAELLSDVLAESQSEVDELVRAGEVTAERGFKESAEFLQLRRQQVELRAERAKLRSGVQRLNAELKNLVGLDAVPGPLLPADQIQVVPEPLDPEQAVRVGLATRPDLLLLRDLAAGLDARTVDAVRQALAGLVPPLRAINAATRVLAPGLRSLLPYLSKPDVESLRRQVRTRLADQEREAAKDIRAAVDDWAGERELVAIARRRAELEAGRVRELEVRRAAGEAVEADYHKARLDYLKAQSDVIREAVKWKQADVKARQEMGLLCGGGVGGTAGCYETEATPRVRLPFPRLTPPARTPGESAR